MSREGAEAADQIVRNTIQITEAATKLAALGAKNLAALLIALAKDHQKLAGKTNLTRLLTEGKAPAVVNIPEKDLQRFSREAKKYGVLFSGIKDKANPTGNMDIITRQEDIPKVNRIFERMGYGVPDKNEGDSKNVKPRAGQGKDSTQRGSGSNRAKTEVTNTDTKPSTKGRIEAIKAAAATVKKGTSPQRTRRREDLSKG